MHMPAGVALCLQVLPFFVPLPTYFHLLPKACSGRYHASEKFLMERQTTFTSGRTICQQILCHYTTYIARNILPASRDRSFQTTLPLTPACGQNRGCRATLLHTTTTENHHHRADPSHTGGNLRLGLHHGTNSFIPAGMARFDLRPGAAAYAALLLPRRGDIIPSHRAP